MKRKHIAGVALLILCLLPFGLAGTRYEKTADLVILGLWSVVVLSMLVYKIWLWFEYRHDPVKREAVLSSTQLLPRKLMQFLLDQGDEQKAETRS